MKLTGKPHAISRRDFLALSAAGTVVFLSGCATNPVSGRKQLMFLSESGEVRLDQENSPHQISADYGAAQDAGLNRYVASVGNQLAALSHRPGMPYTFRAVNAVYVNAYAFPGGTIAVSRGILAAMESEAELAALLGHEIGHVCSRHAAQQYTTGMLGSAAVMAAALVVQQQNEDYAGLTAGLGAIASGALLARYSRANEREADALALEYMTKGGYNPEGCILLMDMLRKMSAEKPGALEMLFATHPMSEERYQTAVREVSEKYQAQKSYSLNRERFQEKTSALRAMKGALELMQNGEKAASSGKYDEAVSLFKTALKDFPADYAGLLMTAKCLLAKKDAAEAEKYAAEARSVYPQEPQALHVLGMAKIQLRRYEAAYNDFSAYENALPGNPNTFFYMGYALENMRRRDEAARHYQAYLRQVSEGDNAKHAYRRLVEWGYIKPQAR
ncbi:MAG: M48 family metalloprotease [Kiritimatiellae bacterium]|nr:M48 family metalloprotease [Kiritimatiellia bacterium]